MLHEVVAPKVGAELVVASDRLTVLLTHGDSGAPFEVFELEGPRDSGPPPHAHAWVESYYVIEGEVLTSFDGIDRVAKAGDFVTVAAGTVHSYRILSDTAKALVTTSGNGASKFFADMDANVAPGFPTAETLPVIVEVAKRNGLTSPIFG